MSSKIGHDARCTGSDSITGLLLAGGAGRRAGNRDKGTIFWQGQALAAHVYARLAAQVGTIVISCNRNLDFYARFNSRCVTDLRADFQGPLAGLEAASEIIHSEYILLAPCDVPLLPAELARRLREALELSPDKGVSYARTGEKNHYLCALLRRGCLESLPEFMDNGGRAVRHWYENCGVIPVDFTQADEFLNINSPY